MNIHCSQHALDRYRERIDSSASKEDVCMALIMGHGVEGGLAAELTQHYARAEDDANYVITPCGRGMLVFKDSTIITCLAIYGELQAIIQTNAQMAEQAQKFLRHVRREIAEANKAEAEARSAAEEAATLRHWAKAYTFTDCRIALVRRTDSRGGVMNTAQMWTVREWYAVQVDGAIMPLLLKRHVRSEGAHGFDGFDERWQTSCRPDFSCPKLLGAWLSPGAHEVELILKAAAKMRDTAAERTRILQGTASNEAVRQHFLEEVRGAHESGNTNRLYWLLDLPDSHPTLPLGEWIKVRIQRAKELLIRLGVTEAKPVDA